MNINNTCPVCGGDRLKDVSAVAPLLAEHHLTVNLCNPGGRELHFRDKGRLQLSDMCNSCDERAIREFLGESQRVT